MKKYAVLIMLASLLTAAGRTPLARIIRKNVSPVAEQPAVTAPGEPNRSDQFPVITSGLKSNFVPAGYGDATRIAFSNGISFDTRNLGKSGEPYLTPELRIDYQDGEPGYYIVQFTGPIYETQKDWLRSNGAAIEFYVPKYGFVCRIPNRAAVDLIRQNPSISWVGIYQPAYKISALFDRVEAEQVVTILLFNDADLEAVLNDVKTISGRNDFDVSANGINKMIVGAISKTRISELSRIKGIYWLEPYIQPVVNNVDVQWIVQDGTSGVRNIWARNIRGQGEVTSSSDTGINTQHYMHRSGSPAITTWGDYPAHNALIAYQPGAPLSQLVWGEAGTSYHGTHTAGTITGDDTTHSPDQTYDGVALKARHYFLDIGGTADTLRMFNDLNDLYILPYNGNGGGASRLCSNSWGAAVTGAYTSNSYAVDQFMWFHPDFLLLFSNGNNGGPSMIVGAPATAKNCVSVGSTDNGTRYNRYAGYTSRGPAADGRYKPTICAPGGSVNYVYSATTGQSTISGMTGTSMACPGACGAAALVRQYLREGWYPYGKRVAGSAWSYISAAMLKAILVNSADTNIVTYTVVPNNAVGWGRIDIDSSLYFNGETRKLLLVDQTTGVLTGERVDYRFSVPAGAANLKITAVWTDYPGNTSMLIQLVNDLDLIAYAPGGEFYRGNQYSANQSIINPAGRDSINVEECVRRNVPIAGDWLVRIEGRNVAMGPQPFALVISYTAAATVAGVVTINKPVYRANDFFTDTVRVRVEDANFGSASLRDTVRVTLSSKYVETQVETLKCAEMAESAYVFQGAMPLRFDKPAHGDGRLSVCQGDTLTVTYNDQSPLYTSTTWAAVDAYYFLISNVHCEKIEAQNVDVCWTTTEGSNSKVSYGTDPGNLNLTAVQDTPYMVSHRVKLTGLTANTLYYYDVESKDFRGNAVGDNNHGAHYTFSTKKTAGIDVLVVVLNDNLQGEEFAHPEFLQNALTAGGWTFNWWKTKENGQFTRTLLKNYKAVYFQVAQENYPVWTVAQKETIKLYHDGGARFAMTGHDAGWDPWANSPSADTVFCKNYLHFRYIGDITAQTWNTLYGLTGDPISGSYTAGIGYQPFRLGAAGDSIRLSGTGALGTGSYVWHGNVANDSCGIKWQSTNPMGSLGDGVWGGYQTRVVHNGFEITQIDTTAPNSPSRTDILNKLFIWLIGHDHPDVNLTNPVAGNTYVSSPIPITWTATAYSGAVVDSTWIEYSPDGGSTWFTIVSGTSITSPYNWNISTLSNGYKYNVRVTVSDRNVYPSMKGFSESGNFRINRPGGDLTGPVTLPNSVIMGINPKIVSGAAGDTTLQFTAVVSDSETGLSTIGAARFYVAGFDTFNCGVSDGGWDEISETVTGQIRLFYLPGANQICSLYVRGRDNSSKALNWGVWFMRTFKLIDGGLGVRIDESGKVLPASYGLSVPLPNPALGQIKIAFALPRTERVSLKIYNSTGQLVKTLVDESRKPGIYDCLWDGQDNFGRKASAGIYFYQLSTEKFQDTKKAVLLR